MAGGGELRLTSEGRTGNPSTFALGRGNSICKVSEVVGVFWEHMMPRI